MDEAMVRKRCAEILSDAPVTGDDMILYRAAYADGLEKAAKVCELEAASVLNEWEHDPDVPSTQHHPKDCKDKCDGYCICQLTFGLLADKIRQHAKEMGHE